MKNNAWYNQKEVGAGSFRLELLWYIYRLLGKTGLKKIAYPITFFFFLFAKEARDASRNYRHILNNYRSNTANFSSFSHIMAYVSAMVDKLDIYSLKKNLPNYNCNTQAELENLTEIIKERQGCFFICSHLGSPEVFLGYPFFAERSFYEVHAFMQVSQSSVFYKFIKKHFSLENVYIHAVEEIGIETASYIKERLEKGAIVIMAGDRVSARNPEKSLECDILGAKAAFPLGVFRFAQLMQAKTFFMHCLASQENSYDIDIKQVPDEMLKRGNLEQLVTCFVKNLEQLTLKYPKQWFHFYRFFTSSLVK